jgi:hypothetical protein
MLHVAARPAVCRFLFDAGLDPQAKNHDGRLPMETLPPDCQAVLEQQALSVLPRPEATSPVTAARRL